MINQKSFFNSHAGGMTFARPYGFEIDFVRSPISGSAVWFFVIILKSIFTLIFEMKIYEKKFLDTKKIHFRSPIFINQHIFKWGKSPASLGNIWPRQRRS